VKGWEKYLLLVVGGAAVGALFVWITNQANANSGPVSSNVLSPSYTPTYIAPVALVG
jgi:hypothetical protein